MGYKVLLSLRLYLSSSYLHEPINPTDEQMNIASIKPSQVHSHLVVKAFADHSLSGIIL